MSTISRTHGGALYFGKIPARGDFVRSANGSAITQGLDRWISAAMERISTHADWKTQFDCAPAINFAICGPRSSNLIIGFIQTSRDTSGRRYPFAIATACQVSDPLQAIPVLPLVAAPAWARMQSLAQELGEGMDVAGTLERLEHAPLIEQTTDLTEPRHELQRLLARMNVGEVEQGLVASGHPVDLRSALLASGLLLMPLLSSNPPTGQASQGLAFPLPAGPQAGSNIAALWLSLITPFFARCDIELGVFHTRLGSRPELVVSLQGASPRLLASVYAPSEAFSANIDLCKAEWVEDYVAADYSLRKLADYLAHPNLSLKQAYSTYAEVFLGA